MVQRHSSAETQRQTSKQLLLQVAGFRVGSQINILCISTLPLNSSHMQLCLLSEPQGHYLCIQSPLIHQSAQLSSHYYVKDQKKVSHQCNKLMEYTRP